MARCKHSHTVITWRATERGHVVFARHCATCGERLGLGPSNDSPPAVVVEMRAGELVQDVTALGIEAALAATAPSGFTEELATLDERNGWLIHSWGEVPGGGIVIDADKQWAGWLARQAFVDGESGAAADADIGMEQPELVDGDPDNGDPPVVDIDSIPPPAEQPPEEHVEIHELEGIDQSEPATDHEDLLAEPAIGGEDGLE